jgi:hypothetical protein
LLRVLQSRVGFFKIGLIMASFEAEGKKPEERDRFTMSVIGLVRTDKHFFSR